MYTLLTSAPRTGGCKYSSHFNLQVLLPYAHAKLSALYERHSSMSPQLPRLGDFRSHQQQAASEGQQVASEGQQEQQGQRQHQGQQSWRQEQLRQLDAQLGGRLTAAVDRLAHWRRHLKALALHAFIKVRQRGCTELSSACCNWEPECRVKKFLMPCSQEHACMSADC